MVRTFWPPKKSNTSMFIPSSASRQFGARAKTRVPTLVLALMHNHAWHASTTQMLGFTIDQPERVKCI